MSLVDWYENTTINFVAFCFFALITALFVAVLARRVSPEMFLAAMAYYVVIRNLPIFRRHAK